MSGGITHISDPKRRTACTTTLKKVPDTHMFAPSCPKILIIQDHFFRSFQRFIATAGHPLSEAVIILPR